MSRVNGNERGHVPSLQNTTMHGQWVTVKPAAANGSTSAPVAASSGGTRVALTFLQKPIEARPEIGSTFPQKCALRHVSERVLPFARIDETSCSSVVALDRCRAILV